MILKCFYVIVSIVLGISTVFCQADEEIVFESKLTFLEAGLSPYFPIGDFANKSDIHAGLGIHVGYLFQWQPDSPVFVGGELNHATIDVLSKDYSLLVDNSPVDVTGLVASAMTGIDIVGRYYFGGFRSVDFYFEGRFGGKMIYGYLSETGVFLDNTDYSNFDGLSFDVVPTYSVGGGMQIKLTDKTYINLRTIFHSTISAKYLKPLRPNIQDNVQFPEDGFEEVHGQTKYVRGDIGVTILFF